jgi:hypothetical protein
MGLDYTGGKADWYRKAARMHKSNGGPEKRG